MRVLIFSPFGPAELTGNSVTVERIQKNLIGRGHRVQIAVPPPGEDATLVEQAIDAFRPDLIHWYHAYKTGRFLLDVRQASTLPSVVTVSGTDLNHDSGDPDRKETMRRVMGRARLVLSASESMRERLRELYPELAPKIRRIRKGVSVGNAHFDLRLAESDSLVLLPGGIRAVKNTEFALTAIDPLAAEFPDLRLVLAGPVLEEEYGRRVLSGMEKRSWASHAGTIPQASMGSAYRRAQAVLNTSLSEGLSNTVMEAMTCGAPVLASDIPGNRNIIRDGVTGWLYDGVDDFRRKLREALLRPGDIGASAAAHAAEHFSGRGEADDLLSAYREALES